MHILIILLILLVDNKLIVGWVVALIIHVLVLWEVILILAVLHFILYLKINLNNQILTKININKHI